MKLSTIVIVATCCRVRGWPRPHQRVGHLRRRLEKLAAARGLGPRRLH